MNLESSFVPRVISLPVQYGICRAELYQDAENWYHGSLALLLLPNLCGIFCFPFIFFAEKAVILALDAASLLFENRFFPPKPNFSSFFRRLLALFPNSSLADCEDLSSLTAPSRATSNKSSSLVVPASVFFRSITPAD